MLKNHNEKIDGQCEADLSERQGTICVLLCDGRLVGPFGKRSDALYWAQAQGLRGYSTYDLLSPENPYLLD